MISQTCSLCFPLCLFIIWRCFLSLCSLYWCYFGYIPKFTAIIHPFSTHTSISRFFAVFSNGCRLSALRISVSFSRAFTPSGLRLNNYKCYEYWLEAKSAQQSIQWENYVTWHPTDWSSLLVPCSVVSSFAPYPLPLSHLVYFPLFAFALIQPTALSVVFISRFSFRLKAALVCRVTLLSHLNNCQESKSKYDFLKYN